MVYNVLKHPLLLSLSLICLSTASIYPVYNMDDADDGTYSRIREPQATYGPQFPYHPSTSGAFDIVRKPIFGVRNKKTHCKNSICPNANGGYDANDANYIYAANDARGDYDVTDINRGNDVNYAYDANADSDSNDANMGRMYEEDKAQETRVKRLLNTMNNKPRNRVFPCSSCHKDREAITSIQSDDSFDIQRDATILLNSFQNYQTSDIKHIIDIMTHRNIAQRLKIAAYLKSEYDVDLVHEFQKLPGNVKYLLIALMRLLPEFNAKVFYRDWVPRLCNKSNNLLQILTTFSANEMKTIEEAYGQMKANIEQEIVVQLRNALRNEDSDNFMSYSIDEYVPSNAQVLHHGVTHTHHSIDYEYLAKVLHKVLYNADRPNIESIIAIFDGRSSDQISEISKSYNEQFNQCLVEALAERLEGYPRDVFIALVTPQPDFNKIWLPIPGGMPDSILSILSTSSNNEMAAIEKAYKRLIYIINHTLQSIVQHRLLDHNNLSVVSSFLEENHTGYQERNWDCEPEMSATKLNIAINQRYKVEETMFQIFTSCSKEQRLAVATSYIDRYQMDLAEHLNSVFRNDDLGAVIKALLAPLPTFNAKHFYKHLEPLIKNPEFMLTALNNVPCKLRDTLYGTHEQLLLSMERQLLRILESHMWKNNKNNMIYSFIEKVHSITQQEHFNSGQTESYLDYVKDANDLYNAKDYEDIIKVLATRSLEQRIEIVKTFKYIYKMDLVTVLKSRLEDENLQDAIVVLLTPFEPVDISKLYSNWLHSSNKFSEVLPFIMSTFSNGYINDFYTQLKCHREETLLAVLLKDTNQMSECDIQAEDTESKDKYARMLSSIDTSINGIETLSNVKEKCTSGCGLNNININIYIPESQINKTRLTETTKEPETTTVKTELVTKPDTTKEIETTAVKTTKGPEATTVKTEETTNEPGATTAETTKEPETSTAKTTKEQETTTAKPEVVTKTETTTEPETTTAKTTQKPETSTAKTTKEPETTTAKTTKEPETSTASTTKQPETTMAKTTEAPEITTAKTTKEPETTTPKTEVVTTAETTTEPETTTAKTTKKPVTTTAKTTKEPETTTAKTTKEPETTTAKTIKEPVSTTAKTTKEAETTTAKTEVVTKAETTTEPETTAAKTTKEPTTTTDETTKEPETTTPKPTKEPETTTAKTTKEPETTTAKTIKEPVSTTAKTTKEAETTTAKTEVVTKAETTTEPETTAAKTTKEPTTTTDETTKEPETTTPKPTKEPETTTAKTTKEPETTTAKTIKEPVSTTAKTTKEAETTTAKTEVVTKAETTTEPETTAAKTTKEPTTTTDETTKEPETTTPKPTKEPETTTAKTTKKTKTTTAKTTKKPKVTTAKTTKKPKTTKAKTTKATKTTTAKPTKKPETTSAKTTKEPETTKAKTELETTSEPETSTAKTTKEPKTTTDKPTKVQKTTTAKTTKEPKTTTVKTTKKPETTTAKTEVVTKAETTQVPETTTAKTEMETTESDIIETEMVNDETSKFNATEVVIALNKYIKENKCVDFGGELIKYSKTYTSDIIQEYYTIYHRNLSEDILSNCTTTKEILVILSTPQPILYAQKIMNCSSHKDVLDILATWTHDDRNQTMEILTKHSSQSNIIEHLAKCLGGAKVELIKTWVEGNKVEDKMVGVQDIENAAENIKQIYLNGCKTDGKVVETLMQTFINFSYKQLLEVIDQFEITNKDAPIETVFNHPTCKGVDIEIMITMIRAARSTTEYFANRLNDCINNKVIDNKYCIDIILSRSNIDLKQIKIDLCKNETNNAMPVNCEKKLENALEASFVPDGKLKDGIDSEYWFLLNIIVKSYNDYYLKTSIIPETKLKVTERNPGYNYGTIRETGQFNVTAAVESIRHYKSSCDLFNILNFLTEFTNVHRMQIAAEYNRTGSELIKDLKACTDYNADLFKVIEALMTPFSEFYAKQINISTNATIDMLLTLTKDQKHSIGRAYKSLYKITLTRHVMSLYPNAPKAFIHQLINGERDQSQKADGKQAELDAKYLCNIRKPLNENAINRIGETLALRSYTTLGRITQICRGLEESLKMQLNTDFYSLALPILSVGSYVREYYRKSLEDCIKDDQIERKMDFLRIIVSRSEIDLRNFKPQLLSYMKLNENVDYLRAIAAICDHYSLRRLFDQNYLQEIRVQFDFQVEQDPPTPSILPASNFSPNTDAQSLSAAITEKNIMNIIEILTRHNQDQRVAILRELQRDTDLSIIGQWNIVSENFKNLFSVMTTPLSKFYAELINNSIDSGAIIDTLVTSSYKVIKQIVMNYGIAYKTEISQRVHSILYGVPQAMVTALLQGRKNENEVIDDQQAIGDAEYLFGVYSGLHKTDDKRFIQIFATYSFASLRKVFAKYQLKSSADIKQIQEKFQFEYKNLVTTIISAAKSTPAYYASKLKDCFDGNNEVIHVNDFNRIIVGRSEVDLIEIIDTFYRVYKSDLFYMMRIEKEDRYYSILLNGIAYPWRRAIPTIYDAYGSKYFRVFTLQSYVEDHFNASADALELQSYLNNNYKDYFINMLVHRSHDQRVEIAKIYNFNNQGENLFNKLQSIFDATSYDIIKALTTPFFEFYADEIHKSNDAIIDMLATWSNYEILSFATVYEKLKHQPLVQVLKSKFSNTAGEFIKLLLEGQQDESWVADEIQAQDDAKFLVALKSSSTSEDQKRIVEIFAKKSRYIVQRIVDIYFQYNNIEIVIGLNGKMDKDLYTLVSARLRGVASTTSYYADQLNACLISGGIRDEICRNNFNRIFVARFNNDLRDIIQILETKHHSAMNEIVEASTDKDINYLYILLKIAEPNLNYDLSFLTKQHKQTEMQKRATEEVSVISTVVHCDKKKVGNCPNAVAKSQSKPLSAL